ncbi:MAG: hypothetical protein BroJett038_25870 [Chloroflexota bacterium]|nr:MAG: hypothetical protein BroJett038_25870 [Chloroflexota bacterium]
MNYLDADFAYFLGMVIARGTISESGGVRQVTISFPYSSLEAHGITVSVDQETSINLGLVSIRERLLDLLNADITLVNSPGNIDLAIRFLRNALPWRSLLSVTRGQSSFRSFQIPQTFLDENTPDDLKREFVKGFADVAGNVRYANRYIDGRHRVRLDVLNHSLNWAVPVQLCLLLQEGLQIPVQNITWGHPNMNRDFREHQINIFALPFLKIGFTFQHKQAVLEELALQDAQRNDNRSVGCPGRRKIRVLKDSNDRENDDRLPPEIRGKHFDSYWQICKAFGCTREPQPAQLSLFEPLESEE